MLRGGDAAAIGRRRWRRPFLALLAFACQVVAVLPDENASRAGRLWAGSLHILSYALLGGFLWANRETPWLWLFAAGALANAVVIAANGGFMPARVQLPPGASDAIPAGFVYQHAVLMGPQTRLGFLGDVVRLPPWLPLRRTLSIGDLVMAAGAFGVVQRLMLHRAARG
jgi:hypothetical protein